MAPEKTLEHRVMEIFADVLGIDSRADIDLQSLIHGELGADSVDLYEVITEIESEFEIGVDADQAEKWKTVGDVIRYVRSKVPRTFTQADVNMIVARAKELGAGPGLTHKMGQFQLSNYAEPHNPHVLAQLIVGGWEEKWDLIWATHALIEFLAEEERRP